MFIASQSGPVVPDLLKKELMCVARERRVGVCTYRGFRRTGCRSEVGYMLYGFIVLWQCKAAVNWLLCTAPEHTGEQRQLKTSSNLRLILHVIRIIMCHVETLWAESNISNIQFHTLAQWCLYFNWHSHMLLTSPLGCYGQPWFKILSYC